MPLPSDEKLLALSEKLLEEFQLLFGAHPGFRPVHAKGVLVTGTFTPSAEAAALTRAPHAARASSAVAVRFSDSTGIPVIPDNDGHANPRGMATRFYLSEHLHTDIISHSVDAFPARTPQEFLEFLKAIAASSDPSKPHPWPIESYLAAHPAAAEFAAPRPVPVSFAQAAYFGVSAVRFTNKDQVSRFGRYRIEPEAGIADLDDAAAKEKDANFLFDELTQRLSKGAVHYQIRVQLANDGDVVDDATIHWPADRKIVNFGRLSLTEFVPDEALAQKKIIFDPIPRVDGIEASDDPLLQLRSAIYLMSGKRRREAPEAAVSSPTT